MGASAVVTLKKIAETCGVSTATVSKALNGKSDIGERTVERVKRVAQELGYLPNAAALSLKTHRTRNLGVLTVLRDKNGMAHDYIAGLISYIQAAAEENGYDVTLLSSSMNGMTLMEHCRYRSFDGVALVCWGFQRPDVHEVIQSEIPCVAIDFFTDLQNNVMTDYDVAYDELVQYAYQMGHRKLAMICGEATFVTKLRIAAFRKACAVRGLSVPEEYMESAYYNDGKTSIEAVRRLIQLDDKPTCIFFPDDTAYMSCLSGLEASGVKMPEDVSAIGFDGVHLSQAIHPRLTTYWQDSEAIGREAVRMLLEAVESPETYVPHQQLIRGRLMIGETVRRLI